MLAAGLAEGTVNPTQAEVIAKALDDLPAGPDPDVTRRAEAHLVGQAGEIAPRELRILGRRVLDVVAPGVGEDHELRLLEAAEALAHRLTGSPPADATTARSSTSAAPPVSSARPNARPLRLRLRDTTCRAHGCDIPAAWCEADQAADPWAHGGSTDLANGQLLRSFHPWIEERAKRASRNHHKPTTPATHTTDYPTETSGSTDADRSNDPLTSSALRE